jgi:hypothetical protein
MVELKASIVVEEECHFVVVVVVMEFVEESMEVLSSTMKEKVQIVVEHDDEVDEVQKQVEVVNELVEDQNYYCLVIEPLHSVVVVEVEVNLASLVGTYQVVVAS